MEAQRQRYPVELMARVLGVSRSGFYGWLSRPPSARSLEDKKLKLLIREVHRWSRQSYGPERIRTELAEQGVTVGRDRIARLRKEMGLRCKQKKKFKATTTSSHALPVAPNLLEQQFAGIRAPGTVYGADITYVWTEEGWLYLAGVKDFATREIIGYAMGERMTVDLVLRAFKKALRYRRPELECLHHSDRGSQYCAKGYQKAVKQAGMRSSMSRKGNCYDNAPTESFWGTLKQELVYQVRFKTRAEAEAAIQEYIEVFYNRIRRHTALGNLAPAVYAETYYEKRRSA